MLRTEREPRDSWTGEPKVTRARKVLLGVEMASEEGSEEILDPSNLSAANLSGQLQKSVEALYTVASFKKGVARPHSKRRKPSYEGGQRPPEQGGPRAQAAV